MKRRITEETVTIYREKGMADGKQMRVKESMERGMTSGTMDMFKGRRRRSIGGRVTTVISRRK